jgi:hypothetical protein
MHPAPFFFPIVIPGRPRDKPEGDGPGDPLSAGERVAMPGMARFRRYNSSWDALT